jgi:hypothetical protein
VDSVPANEVIPFYEAAYTQKLTVHFAAAVTGGRFCAPLTTFQSGPGLATTAEGSNLQCAGVPAAGGDVGGVVGWDVAIGGKAPVIRGAGTMLPVKSGAAVTAGNDLEVDTLGRVTNWVTPGVRVGRAHSTVAGADLDVIVELYAPTPFVTT